MARLEDQDRYRGEAEVDRKTPFSFGRRSVSHLVSFLLTFPILMILWLVLSGRFDALHIFYGVVSSALVAYLSGDFLFPRMGSLSRLAGIWLRFPAYLAWLLKEILKANIHLLYLTFHPKMLRVIDPQLIRFRSNLASPMAMVILANSITLTPGTITVRISPEGDFVVHAIDRVSAGALPGEMEKKIARLFGEV